MIAGHTPPPFDHAGLVALGRYLQRTHYRHIAVTPLTHGYNNARAGDRTGRTVRDIFGWSRPFSRDVVTDTEFGLMTDAGILAPVGDLWRSTIRWATLYDHLCAHSAFPTLDHDAVFFGPDTYRFARMIRQHLAHAPARAPRIRNAVDVGCGSGAGALLIADACPDADVIAADINPKALHLTRVNAELARTDVKRASMHGAHTSRITPRRSDLLTALEGTFDLIVANPPYMLDNDERAYRHGGGTLGEGLAAKIVDAALQRLTPGGTLLLYTGVAIVDGHDAFRAQVEERLRERSHHGAYEELDPDVFPDELLKPAYARVERIAAVALTITTSA